MNENKIPTNNSVHKVISHCDKEHKKIIKRKTKNLENETLEQDKLVLL